MPKIDVLSTKIKILKMELLSQNIKGGGRKKKVNQKNIIK